MPNTELGKMILAENKALREDIGCLSEELHDLDDEGKHTRWITYGITVVLVLMAIAWGYNKTNDRIDNQAKVDIASCERNNVSREAQRQQWIDVRAALARFKDPETTKLANGLVTNAFKNFPALDCRLIQEGKEPVAVTPSVQPTTK